MNTVALTSEVGSALAKLTSRLPAAAKADEVHFELREAMLERELSQDIQTLLSAQHEFATPRLISALSGATGFQPYFVAPMLLREARRRQSPEAAVAWLQKVLSTERAEGIAIETFWGFTPTVSEAFHDDVQLVPFTSLPPSRQKEALLELRLDPWPGRLATPPFACQAPPAALVRPAIIQPFFRTIVDDSLSPPDNGAAYAAYNELFGDARLCLATSGPAAIVPGPAWFQYTDPDLELAQLGQDMYLTHQEITPLTIQDFGQVDPARAATLLRLLVGLNDKWKNRARTAMQRLGLACLRRGPADRALELAIALESLLVDSPGEHTFKIALRAALLTSTELESRRRHRAIIEAMYQIRSSLMHSGHSSDTCKVRAYGNRQTTEIVSEALKITAMVIQGIVGLGVHPDWCSLELSNLV
ncbi:MAG: hypothetical protein DDT21_00863 [Syntrophomonadaceae bacterium]|nr:hypothetical protein [Bacillota bacterium]